MIDIAKITGLYIKEVRLKRAYSQEYLAYRLNLSQNAYSKIELGLTKITVERTFQIAAILDFPIAEFFNFITESKRDPQALENV